MGKILIPPPGVTVQSLPEWCYVILTVVMALTGLVGVPFLAWCMGRVNGIW